jgi:hypothetical protein
LKGYNEILEAI